MGIIVEEIIKNFVVKNKQERIIWELNNQKKRENVMLRRFPGTSLFKERCLQPIEVDLACTMEERLLQLGGGKEVYFIGDDYIGLLPLSDAAKRATAGEICIIYFGNGKGYYQGERDYGTCASFFLDSTGDSSVCSEDNS